MRNDCDGATSTFQLGDCKADAFDRDGSFEHRVLLNLRREFNMQPPVFGIPTIRVDDAFELDQLAYAIDVSLHNVAIEAAIGLHGQFQVHQRTLVNSRKRSPHPGFGRKVGAERGWLDVQRCKADAADRHAAAGFQLFRSIRSFDGDAPVFPARFNFYNFTHFLDDSSKHKSRAYKYSVSQACVHNPQ